MSSVSVAAIGDVLDINCHSNMPWFLFHEGKRQGLFSDPVRLNLSSFTWRRRFWNVRQAALLRGVGGYQYSSEFLEQSERQVPPHLFEGQIITFSQVFPRANTVRRSGGKMIYYVDATIQDLVNNPSYNVKLPRWILDRALRLERENYELATHVVAQSTWIIPSLTSHYGVDERKISHILPGANVVLPENWAPLTLPGRPGIDRDLILGFVGKDWRRKGFPFLMDVQAALVKRGFKVRIKAIGHIPSDLPSGHVIEYTGFVDKRTEMNKFVREISGCDIGCLFSASEALGLSPLEFLRVGVPVAGYYHQGMRDTLLKGASFRFDLTDSPDEVASHFEGYIHDEDLQHEMKRRAMEYSNDVTWEATVKHLGELIR